MSAALAKNPNDAVSLAIELETRLGPLGEQIDTAGWLQALVELGYVPESMLEVREASVIESGVDRFRLENSFDPSSPFARFRSSGGSMGRLTPAEQNTLRQLVSFDGDLCVTRMPSLGECSVWSRTLHYRLRCLNLFHGDVAGAVSTETQRALLRFVAVFGGEPESVATLVLLGDADALGQRWLERGLANHEMPVLLRAPPGLAPEGELGDLYCGKSGFVSVRQALLALGADTARAWQLGRILSARSTPGVWQQTEANLLGRQILQLKLWMSGHYAGRLDGWWGPHAIKALQEAGRAQALLPQQLVRHVGNGDYAINARVVFGKLLAREHAELGDDARFTGIVAEGLRAADYHARLPKTLPRPDASASGVAARASVLELRAPQVAAAQAPELPSAPRFPKSSRPPPALVPRSVAPTAPARVARRSRSSRLATFGSSVGRALLTWLERCARFLGALWGRARRRFLQRSPAPLPGGEPSAPLTPPDAEADRHLLVETGHPGQVSFLSEVWEQVVTAARRAHDVGARVYTGAKTLLGGALRAVRGGLHWLRAQATRLAPRTAQFFRWVCNQFTSGVRALADAFKTLNAYVLGNHLVTSDDNYCVLSQHALDADAQRFVQMGTSPELIQAHRLACRRRAQALAEATTLIENTLSYLMLPVAGPLSWFELASRLSAKFT